VTGVTTWANEHPSLRSIDVAVYFPRVSVPDPLQGSRLRPTPPSGTVAGLCARIDASRGVWHAPAGADATLLGVAALECLVTDAEAGALGALNINALRVLPGHGPTCWGARTFAGDGEPTGFGYVSVRRLARLIESSLTEGTAWASVERNGPPLWAQVRQDVASFMQTLFRQAALQGSTPRDAYFVKCDEQTTTADDIRHGVLNVVVGFAPLKPAEFVVIEIRQLLPSQP
jgi:hypothetical protein